MSDCGSVFIDLSGVCNLRCKHCYLPHKYSKKKISTNIETLGKAINNLVTNEFIYLNFTGNEPLCVENIADCIALAKSEHFLVKLKTNGVLLTQELAFQLKKAGLHSADISLYSSVFHEHDAVTGVKGSFDAALQAITFFHAAKIKVNISTPLIKPLIDLEKMYLFINSLNISNWTPDPVIFGSFDHRNSVEQCKLSKSAYKQFLSFMLEKGLYKHEQLYNPNKKGAICGMGDKAAFIDSDYNYHFCLVFPTNTGNILDTDISSYKQQAALVRASIEHNRPCLTCTFLPYCQPCPALSLIEDGNMFACSASRKNYAEAVREVYLEKGGIEKNNVSESA